MKWSKFILLLALVVIIAIAYQADAQQSTSKRATSAKHTTKKATTKHVAATTKRATTKKATTKTVVATTKKVVVTTKKAATTKKVVGTTKKAATTKKVVGTTKKAATTNKASGTAKKVTSMKKATTKKVTTKTAASSASTAAPSTASNLLIRWKCLSEWINLNRNYTVLSRDWSWIQQLATTTTGHVVVDIKYNNVTYRPGRDFFAHVHNASCSVGAGGGHVKANSAISGAVQTNELWFNMSTTVTAPPTYTVYDLMPNSPRIANMNVSKAIVIHEATGGKIACCDLTYWTQLQVSTSAPTPAPTPMAVPATSGNGMTPSPTKASTTAPTPAPTSAAASYTLSPVVGLLIVFFALFT